VGGGAVLGGTRCAVESVAWVAERKDVLSAFSVWLGLMAYARYAEGRTEAESKGQEPEAGYLGLWSVVRGLSPFPPSIFYLLSVFLARPRVDEQGDAGDVACVMLLLIIGA